MVITYAQKHTVALDTRGAQLQINGRQRLVEFFDAPPHR
jgi:hypothetical protein